MKIFLHTTKFGARVSIQLSYKLAASFSSTFTPGSPITFPNGVVAYPQGCGWYRASGDKIEIEQVHRYVSNKFDVIRKEQIQELKALLLRAQQSTSTGFQNQVVRIVKAAGFGHVAPSGHNGPKDHHGHQTARVVVEAAVPQNHQNHQNHQNKVRRAPSPGALQALCRKLTRHVG